jgi:hypothetical protein
MTGALGTSRNLLIHCLITKEGRGVKQGDTVAGGTSGNRVHTHRKLEQTMHRLVGETATVQYVHSHPRMARMVCL